MARSSGKKSSKSSRISKKKAKKPRTGSKRPQKTNSLITRIERIAGRKILWASIVTWIICATFLGLLLLKHKPHPKQHHERIKSKLLYERPEPLGIESKIQKIDLIIYHSLLDSGLYSENIKYRVEKRKNKSGTFWEYCEMIIPTKGKIKNFNQQLKKRLQKKLPNAKIQIKKGVSGASIITISIGKITTHCLIFKEKPQKIVSKEIGPKPKIAIIIDDFGPVYKQAKDFLKIKAPITFSILPFRKHSLEIAKLVHDRGFEVMLHLPMEPHGYPAVNPGEGALLLRMSDAQIRTITNKCLDDLDSYISGVNNHMGSAFTENKDKMKVVLEEIKKRHLFFLDSLTSPRSVAFKTARSLHLHTISRDIFLDVRQSKEFVNGQLKKLVAIAKRRGKAVAIGHPYTVTLVVLKDKLAKINATEARIVPVSELIK